MTDYDVVSTLYIVMFDFNILVASWRSTINSLLNPFSTVYRGGRRTVHGI